MFTTAVANLLTASTLNDMDERNLRDATASLSAICALMSPEQRTIRADMHKEARRIIPVTQPERAPD